MMFPMALPSMSCMLLSCMMLLSQVQGEDLHKEQRSPKINCPSGSMAFSSFCYALFTAPKTWFEADLACQKRQSGHLVSVLSGSEASFLASLIKNSGNESPNVWIGLHDPTEGRQPDGGGWEWISSDVLNYRAWEQYPPEKPDSGYCVSVSQHTGYRKWVNNNCELSLPYVCKFKN